MHEQNNLSDIARAICNEHHYTYLTEAGKGASKENFHVQDTVGNEFALKVYMSDRRNERENREIAAMEKCIHPNIAKFYALGSFIYMQVEYLFSIEEFIGGGTLRERLKSGSLDKHAVIALGGHLIDAVSHIASRNLVHRDLKPANILFRRSTDIPVVVDFGIVRDLNATSITGSWQIRGPGTPLYAAPEQLNNEKTLQDWRTDQFSLGVLLSEAVFGKHPFDYDGVPHHTVDAVATRRDVSSEFRENIRESGLVALEKMVSPFPVRRYLRPIDLAKAWVAQR